MARTETIYLDLDTEEAARRIAERVPNLRRRTDDGAVTFHTNVGLHLATLTDATLPSGERGSRLRYRTSLVRAHLLHARDAARAIRDAVEPYRVE